MLQDKTGQQVPNVTFKTIKDGEWQEITSSDLFDNKTVVVISLPGAFTPTCSSTHLPRFNELAQTFKQHGVDDIICMSVNDTFVMNAWSEDQEAENITVIPDGNGEFTDGMGMLVDKADLGFGKRSWRYAMVVKNGTVDQMFIEPQKPGDPFEVSDADTVLAYLAPNAEKPQPVAIFTKPGCPHCAKAKALLNEKGMRFEELTIGQNTTLAAMKAVSNRETVPQVFIGGEHIGGNDELQARFA